MTMETGNIMTTDLELEDSEEPIEDELMGNPLEIPYNTFAGMTAAKAAALVSKQLG